MVRRFVDQAPKDPDAVWAIFDDSVACTRCGRCHTLDRVYRGGSNA